MFEAPGGWQAPLYSGSVVEFGEFRPGKLLAAAAILLVAPATAGDVDAAMLVEYCGATADGPDSQTAIAFCYGYIDAALGYHHAILSSDERITCPAGSGTGPVTGPVYLLEHERYREAHHRNAESTCA